MKLDKVKLGDRLWGLLYMYDNLNIFYSPLKSVKVKELEVIKVTPKKVGLRIGKEKLIKFPTLYSKDKDNTMIEKDKIKL